MDGADWPRPLSFLLPARKQLNAGTLGRDRGIRPCLSPPSGQASVPPRPPPFGLPRRERGPTGFTAFQPAQLASASIGASVGKGTA